MNTKKIDVKRGLERLARIYCWPNVPTIADKDKYEFRALSEFVLFKEFVMNPFFKILLRYLFKHIADLYKHLSTSLKEKTNTLTYKEAYLFMQDLGVDKVKLILEQVSYPSNVYNGIMKSLEDENYDLFFSTLDKSDYTNMMQVLWEMRYILFGERGDLNGMDPSIPYLIRLPYMPRWIKMDDYYYRPYFEIHEYDDEDIFIDKRVIKIVHGRLRKKRRTNDNPSPSNNHNNNFEEDNKKELERLFKESLFKSQWKDLLTEFSDNSDLPVRNGRVNTSYIKNLAILILTHNVILHKDKVMEKYGIDSSEMYNEFRYSEVCIYESGDCEDFGRYILYYTWEILNIYKIVKDLLPEHERETIQLLLARYPKKDNEFDIIANNHTTNHNQGKKLFVTVLDSKLKGNTSEERKSKLLNCLSLLYEELTKEGCNLIDTATPKELFIYRFSGIGDSYPLTAKIKWRGKNVLLGHIVRCLLSDKKYGPDDMGAASDFFESKSGKPINLATAKQVSVIDFEKKRDYLNSNFVEAVELLRRCGFINVEYTSKRR